MPGAPLALAWALTRRRGCRRRRDETASWQAGVIAGARRDPRGQRVTVVYNADTPSEWFEGDVVLAKSKTGVLWRFAQPPDRHALEWETVLARAAAAGAAPRADRKPPAASAAPAAKRRRVDGIGSGGDGADPPFREEVLQAALAAARASGSAAELRTMCVALGAARARIIEALAVERCREALAGAAGASGYLAAASVQ